MFKTREENFKKKTEEKRYICNRKDVFDDIFI